MELNIGDRVKVLPGAAGTLRGRYGHVIALELEAGYATVQFNDFTERIKVVELKYKGDTMTTN